MTRRARFGLGAVLSLFVLLPGEGELHRATQAATTPLSPIGIENALPGTQAWRITSPGWVGAVEGYAGQTSFDHGETVDIHARTDGASSVRWELYRIGFYGGAGGRLLASGGPLAIGPQPTPAPTASTGLVECAWPVSFTIATDPSWPSGMYLVKLFRDDGPERYVPFVLRADERKGTGVFLASVATYQAYNAWGGESLYSTSSGQPGGYAKEVSFDRPYDSDDGAGQLFEYESKMVLWAEARGYDLSYVTDVDLDRDPSLLTGQKIFLSVGHGEYWSRPERSAVEAALASGVDAAFFSGNEIYWQVRFEPARSSGASRRTQVCHKFLAPQTDPLAGTPLVTERWRDPDLSQPENGLMGVMYDVWQFASVPWVVQNASSWFYAGTGLQDGDVLRSVVGYEADRIFGNGFTPSGTTVLAHSPFLQHDGGPGWHDATLYTLPSGAFVVATGTIEWAWGLGQPGIADPRIQRITANVLEHAGLVPTSAGSTFGAGTSPVDRSVSAALVSTVAGAPFQEGLIDGPAASARFRRPVGLTAGPSGEVYVADAGNHAIRMITPGGSRTVTTLAGTGAPGCGQGPGSQTALNTPQGVALGADGNLYATDSGNHRVVRLARDGAWTVSTFAGSPNGIAGRADGQGTALFSSPSGITAVGGDLYVADSGNDRICRISADGTVTTVVGGGAGLDGPGLSAQLRQPTGIASGGGSLWVADTGSRLLRQVALDGAYTTRTVAGSWPGGYADGPASQALLVPAVGLAYTDGALLVSDLGNDLIRRIASGQVSTYAGSGRATGADGTGETASFALPSGLALLPSGDLLVADNGDSTLRVVSAGSSAAGGGGGGTGGGGGGGGVLDGGMGGGGGGESGPTAVITGGPFSGDAPLLVEFDATTSQAGAGRWVTTVRWDFGDGSASAALDLLHTFPSSGTYSVRLTLTDDAGAVGSAVRTVIVGGARP
jgi:sugar lactone lactonase YvrE